MLKVTFPVRVPFTGFSMESKLCFGSRTGLRYQPIGLHRGREDVLQKRHSA